MLYHVVCRECPTERVFEHKARATAEQEVHAGLHDHTVVVGEVEPP